ncbi:MULTISPECIES: DUF6473 family protein [Rhodobacterales]|uniref:DUF6473 domain-containing protein n=1 Tax=Halocynthiibacter styelae TaxID=2761955 RepID=A0A8J7LPK1_9RHOB|nr:MULTISPECIES: DUF6473 family protein [Rhodobacterales]MBI1492932.1 hypothetical protein [Paenihalocynthiibacter styelae]
MAYENLSESLLDYYPCRYGKSKLLFRGPKRKLDQPYVAYLGGTQTYGKFIEKPYSDIVEELSGVMSVNLGCVNAGIDVYAHDQAVMDVCHNAELTVVQVLGAQNMSNRFYSVHPRRNDRFVRASTLLQTIYREVDFTEFNFTRHLLTSLKTLSPDRFEIVRRELKDAWVARMKNLLSQIEGKKLLVWLSEFTPEDEEENIESQGDAPLFIDREMINALDDQYDGYLEIVPPADMMSGDTDGMVISPMEEPTASELMSVTCHQEVAQVISDAVSDLLQQKGPRNRRAL